MELRTRFEIDPSKYKITYSDPVMFIGSCFATSIGQQFETGHMPVMINPMGTVYNPVSVYNTIENIINGKQYLPGDLYNHNGRWISFDHYSDFTSAEMEVVLDRINGRAAEAFDFISSAGFLFITFGTARVFRWKHSGRIVSNCHRIPAPEFTNELLTVDYITSIWNDMLDRLNARFPDIKVVFTISPVRHLKDGAHGNQVSKSVLFLAVEELLAHPTGPLYFPAYELVMDDLRDYRYYGDDMLHISDLAVKYIWDAFCSCFLDDRTKELWNEVEKVSRAMLHKLQTDDISQIKQFATNIISKIDRLTGENYFLDLEKERSYFQQMLNAI